MQEFIRTISNEKEDNESDEVELTHDELMDEDVAYNANTCSYFKTSGDINSEMTLNYIIIQSTLQIVDTLVQQPFFFI